LKYNIIYLLSESDFRNQMLNYIKGFSGESQSGLFINSCFAHCQTELQDTWFADNSPVIGHVVCMIQISMLLKLCWWNTLEFS